MPNDKQPQRYPNNLRKVREGQCLTRRQLSLLTSRLAKQDSVRYSEISEDAIKALELGWSRPRLGTMGTLAEALQAPAQSLFPNGPADSVRNPEGKTGSKRTTAHQ